jgi:tetratricopeptide (TPR) repeat protein
MLSGGTSLFEYNFDVFLSHSSQDKPVVRQVAEALRARGLNVWFDEWNLTPGRRWISELEQAVATTKVVIVLVGKHGYGHWEQFEYEAALSELVSRGLPILPVLLPGAPEKSELPSVLRSFTWVDLRAGLSREGLDRLEWGVTGKRPSLNIAPPVLSPPRLHNLPLTSLGELFKGREEELRSLRDSLGDSAHVEVIHGLAGIGKTRLAIEYAWRSGDRYDTALFVVADSSEALLTGLARLAEPDILNLPEHETATQEQVIAAVKRWFRDHDRWLLILDNVGTPPAMQVVSEILPSLSAGQVIITSRIRDWPPIVRKLALDVLSAEATQEFLLQRTEDERTRSADDAFQVIRLAQELEGLPLALEQAAAYIVHHQMTLAAYMERWNRERGTILEWHNTSVAQHPSSFIDAWQQTFTQLSYIASAVLHLTAWLAPDPIPIGMFESGAEVVQKASMLLGEETEAAIHAGLVMQGISELAAYSLAIRDNDKLTIHRLVQEVLRHTTAEEKRQSWIELSLTLVNDFAPPDTHDVRNWPTWESIHPHALSVIEHADQIGITDPTATLMNEVGVLYQGKGFYAKAEPLLRRALQIDEESFGHQHLNVARDLNNLGQLLQATNRLAEAEPLMRRALFIHEDLLGPRHPNVATQLSNLASLLQSTNRLDEAEPLIRRALQIHEDALGPNSHNVSIDLNNLAQLLATTNRLDEAEPLMRRALQIDESYFGAHHPNIAIRLNNLAELLQATNRLAEAEPLLQRALQIDLDSFGPQHSIVAVRLNNLAELLQATNRLSEAEHLMLRALDVLKKSLGPDHPNTQIVRRNLASVLEEIASGSDPHLNPGK